MTHHVAMIKGRVLKYSVRRNPRARRKQVRVSRDQGLVVTLPMRARMEQATELIEAWADWIVEKVDEQGVWNGPVVRNWATGSELMLFGRIHTLQLSALPAGRSRMTGKISDDVLHLELPPKDLFTPFPSIKKFLKKEAKKHLTERVQEWSRVTGLKPDKIRITDTRSRWGSCSARGTISLCYRLIMAPPEVCDAIVVHELCHLRHLNHGQGFYTLLESHLPDYQQVRRWLKTNSEAMQL